MIYFSINFISQIPVFRCYQVCKFIAFNSSIVFIKNFQLMIKPPKKFFSIIIFIFTALVACSTQKKEIYYVTSSAPLAMIIHEVAGPQIKVEYIVPPNTSPHTYNPKPSDALKIAKATAVFFVSKTNDGWIEKFSHPKIIETLRLVDKSYLLSKEQMKNDATPHAMEYSHHHDNITDTTFDYQKYDSHFWTDPILIKSLTSKIIDTLSKIDPLNAQTYKTNGETFIKKLTIIDKQISSIVSNIKDKPIFLHHPSFLYFIKRYGLTYGGSIEPNPGQELSPSGFANIVAKIKNSGVKAIFSEPQLPDKLIKSIAFESGVAIYELDPIGTNFKNYNDFILFNANKLKEALE